MVRYIGFYKIQCVLAILYIYRPANEVCEGYVFTGVCLLTGEVSASGPGGVSASGPGEGYLPLVPWGVSATPSQTPSRQASPWADTPGQTPPLPSAFWDTHPLPSACWDAHTPCPVHAGIRSTSRRYASHWNAFLFIILMLAVGMAINIYVAPKHFRYVVYFVYAAFFARHFRVFIVCNIPEYLTLCHNTKVNSITITNGSIIRDIDYLPSLWKIFMC